MTWHHGRCGIHRFLDVERARARKCDVCEGFLTESLDEPVKRRMTEKQKANSKQPAPPQTKRIIAGMVRASIGEKQQKAEQTRFGSAVRE